MWMFKPFSGKDQAGLEGRLIEIGNEKIRVQNMIAEGGFSCVYHAHDATNISKQYALKHVICQDGESLDLAMKEIQVMKLLKGNPNVVTLVAHSIVDMGRRKEVLFVLEFCEKSLVSVLESRGAGYFEEKQILYIFRDVCNAVFAMHSMSPPIAHRDLKVENVLLGSEGAWKLCDFGSTSTNHKCFDRPEEMGIEEDNIRKYTTPAYRAPEMWDLYRREVISEKVDIWALGCLLYRICFLKSAFDGESKLQILNGNFRIPELPKYNPCLIGLIKDMLQGSPIARPDITQVWFRVNQLLPVELQKQSPDSIEAALPVGLNLDLLNEGTPNRAPVKPTRSPPPPPALNEKGGSISHQLHDELQKKPQGSSKVGPAGSTTPIGAFWSTQFAQDAQLFENKGVLFDEAIIGASKSNSQINQGRAGHYVEEQVQPFPNSFIADFDSNKLISSKAASNINKLREEELVAEIEKLKAQLKQTNLDKAEVSSKYEKLTSICRSQRQEIQDLKLALAASAPAPPSASTHGFSVKNPEPEAQAFAELSMGTKVKHSKSVRTINGRPSSSKQSESSPGSAEWSFGHGSFTASPSSKSETSMSPALGSSSQQRQAAANAKKVESSQPAGWAGF